MKLDLDFSKFILNDEEEDEREEQVDEVLESGVMADDSKYEDMLDLNKDETSVKVDTEFPYIRVEGLLIPAEVKHLIEKVKEFCAVESPKYNDDNLLNVVMYFNNSEYVIGKAPLTLDTILTLKKTHDYKVTVVQDIDSEVVLTSNHLKTMIFT